LVVSVIEIDQIETMLKGREVFMKAPIVGSAGLFWWRGHAKRLANLFKRTGHARPTHGARRCARRAEGSIRSKGM